MLPSQALTATVTELEQPHRFQWRVDTHPDGWQAHVFHAASTKGDNAQDAIETAVAHMKNKGMSDELARKAIKVVRLKPLVAEAPPKPVAPTAPVK